MKKIKTAIFIFKLTWKANPFYLTSVVAKEVINWIKALASVLLTKELIDALQSGSILSASIFAVVYLSALFLSAILQRIITAKQKAAQNDLHTKTLALLGQHYVELPYDITRHHDNQEIYQMAVKCVNEGYEGAFINYILEIVFGIGVIASMLYVLRIYPIGMFVLLFISFAVDVLANIRQSNLLYNNYVDETPIERSLYYARGTLMFPKYAKELRLYKLNHFVKTKTEEAMLAFYKQSEKTRIQCMPKLLLTYIAEAVQYVGVYAYAIYKYYKDTTLSLGEFSLIITSTVQFSHTVRSMTESGVNLYKNLKYVEMLQSFLELNNFGDDNKNNALFSNKPHLFQFKNVSFRYSPEGSEVLHDVNVEFSSTDKISIVGENGAGKTTFVLLLLGFLKPTSGEILIDGVDINNIDHKKYIDLFSPVFQDFKIYDATISENVVLSQKYNNSKVIDSLRLAGLDIDKFPKKDKSNIGNIYESDGVELSGGESQKLAMARAIYKTSSMFILDEPTAALDPRAECELYSNFGQISGDRGVIFISHRLASCKLCEKIFVFDEGKLIENGSHEQLMKDNSKYCSLFTAQSQLYNDGIKDSEVKN